MKAYLAGPMSGIPKFNFPEFYEAAAVMRMHGWDIVSPAEMDASIGIADMALASTDGDNTKLTQTWGDLLARDVKLIADGGIEAIIFLPGWEKSKGARLEATVGLLQGYDFRFFQYDREQRLVKEMRNSRVAFTIMGTFL
jgi:Domain of unknown function (DUF4406)